MRGQTALPVTNAAGEREGCRCFRGLYFSRQICRNPGAASEQSLRNSSPAARARFLSEHTLVISVSRAESRGAREPSSEGWQDGTESPKMWVPEPSAAPYLIGSTERSRVWALYKTVTQRATQGEILPTQNSPAKPYQGSAL